MIQRITSRLKNKFLYSYMGLLWMVKVTPRFFLPGRYIIPRSTRYLSDAFGLRILFELHDFHLNPSVDHHVDFQGMIILNHEFLK